MFIRVPTRQLVARGSLLWRCAAALLVGAIGVANIMVISLLERRSEIGLRHAPGATRGQIRAQFLAEAMLLSLVGGTAGVILGAAATAIYACSHGEAVVISADAWAAVWPPPCSSAPSPGCYQPSALPASRRQRRCGASDSTGSASQRASPAVLVRQLRHDRATRS